MTIHHLVEHSFDFLITTVLLSVVFRNMSPTYLSSFRTDGD